MRNIEGFEVDENEIDSLQDKLLETKALTIFYGSLVKLSMLNDVDAVKNVFEQVDQQLLELYNGSDYFDQDFHRIEGQLLRCFNQKAKMLRKSPERRVEEDDGFSMNERREYESMENDHLKVRAKRIYCLGKKRLKLLMDAKSLLSARDEIAGKLEGLYENGGSIRALGKWVFMLDIYVKELADSHRARLSQN